MKFWSLLALFVLISSCVASRHHDIGSIVNKSMFEKMLKHRNDDVCPAKGFYTYEGFIKAAKKFKGFGTSGSIKTRKREIAAFLGQTSHETTGGWETAPDGPFAWGYCFIEEVAASGGPDYCEPDPKWPCAPHKKYFGRGPIQLSYNFNYGPAGKELGYDLLRNPDAVANSSAISFETALWFWMTPQDPKPSCHEVIIGRWKPTPRDRSAGRNPGYGAVTNIVNGGIECGKGPSPQGENRVGFYKRYCDFLDVSYGPNLDCDSQTPFGSN